MDNIFYLWAIIEIIHIISLIFRKDTTEGVNPDNPIELIRWTLRAEMIIPIVTIIWTIVGLFSELWLLFLLFILVRIIYRIGYNHTTSENHNLFWYFSKVTYISVLVTILFAHFYSIIFT